MILLQCGWLSSLLFDVQPFSLTHSGDDPNFWVTGLFVWVGRSFAMLGACEFLDERMVKNII